MRLSEIIDSLLNRPKKIDIRNLPSQGMFYKKDFEMKIKKADVEDIIEYEHNYDGENLFSVIESLKKVVRKNTIFTNRYSFDDIKSVDVVFVFLEIVRHTTNKPIRISYFDNQTGMSEIIEFNHDNFNYFDFSKYNKMHDPENGEFLIDGYRFSMPSIGAENSITQFLVSKGNSKKWANYNYDFLFYIGNKSQLSFDEIENLITIFNSDMEDSERQKVTKIKNRFSKLVGYSLKKEGRVIEIKSKLDLQTIWKN